MAVAVWLTLELLGSMDFYHFYCMLWGSHGILWIAEYGFLFDMPYSCLSQLALGTGMVVAHIMYEDHFTVKVVLLHTCVMGPSIYIRVSWVLLHTCVMGPSTYVCHGSFYIRVSWVLLHMCVMGPSTYMCHGSFCIRVMGPFTYVCHGSFYIHVSWVLLHMCVMGPSTYVCHGSFYIRVSCRENLWWILSPFARVAFCDLIRHLKFCWSGLFFDFELIYSPSLSFTKDILFNMPLVFYILCTQIHLLKDRK